MQNFPSLILGALILPLFVHGQSNRPPLTPQAQRGQALFQKSPKGVACGTCHTLGGIGTAVGPDLSKLASAATPRGLVMAIEMTMTAYVQQVKTAKSEFPGIQKQKVGDTASADIRSMRGNEKWAHPPTAAQYNAQELADIIGFLKFASTGLQKEVTPAELGKLLEPPGGAAT